MVIYLDRINKLLVIQQCIAIVIYITSGCNARSVTVTYLEELLCAVPMHMRPIDYAVWPLVLYAQLLNNRYVH